MYTFDAIILEKKIISEKKIQLITFTKEYGKITLWSYKQITGVDIWDIARIVMRRKESVNVIASIETKEYLAKKSWNFNALYSFLWAIKTLDICIAPEQLYPQIFHDYNFTLKQNTNKITEDYIELFLMRVFKQLGSLSPTFFEGDAVLQYMYTNISKTPIEKIIASKPLKQEYKETIKSSNLFALSVFQ